MYVNGLVPKIVHVHETQGHLHKRSGLSDCPLPGGGHSLAPVELCPRLEGGGYGGSAVETAEPLSLLLGL